MLHLFVHQYLFLKCITEFLHWNYHWVFLWFCRLYSDGLALGVWFMTSCCCLVEFGFSCFNHASIESWFANYSVLDILQYESPVPPHPKGALLDWDLVTVEAIWVKWTHCHVQETSLRWFELCDMVHYPAGCRHQKMVHCSHKGMDMVSNNTQVGCGV